MWVIRFIFDCLDSCTPSTVAVRLKQQSEMLARPLGTTSLHIKHEVFWGGARCLSCQAYPLHLISCCWKAFDRLCGAAKNELHDYTCPACRPLCRVSHTDLQEQTSQRKPGQDGCAPDPTQSGCRKNQASWKHSSNDRRKRVGRRSCRWP